MCVVLNVIISAQYIYILLRAVAFLPAPLTWSEDGRIALDRNGKLDMVLYPHFCDVDDDELKGKRECEDGVYFAGSITDASETSGGFREYTMLRNRATGQVCLERVQTYSKSIMHEREPATAERIMKIFAAPSIPQDRHHESKKRDGDDSKPMERESKDLTQDVAAAYTELAPERSVTEEKSQFPSRSDKGKVEAMENLMEQVGDDLMNQLTGRSDGWKALDM